MKKLLFTAFCLFALMATSASLMAQEITITVHPGWTWISYTRADTLTFAEALGYFTPANGDIIKSQGGSASFRNGRWGGSLQQFIPGLGYMYYSSRTEPISFVYTHAYQPEVSTGTVSGITTTSATVGGNFVNDGGATMKRCGICWGTNENPTVNNSIVTLEELALGEYAMELTNLVPGTTYHARAFATNTVGTTYGEDVSFTTLEEPPAFPDGAINSLFTVNASGVQVYFSQGNLQYIGSAAEPYWKFADHQWEYFGENGQGGDSPTADRDLFGWGTSGYNHGANCYQPWSNSTNNYDYCAYGDIDNDLNSQMPMIADWGYNVISNGGNNEGSGWRSLTGEEWYYLTHQRTTVSGILATLGRIENSSGIYVNGIILLPDDWNASIYTLNYPNQANSWDGNTISIEDWTNLLEANGAVFLPASGWRRWGSAANGLQSEAIYWSSTHSGSGAIDIAVAPGYYNFYNSDYYGRTSGLAVRLVRNASAVPPTVTTLNASGVTSTTAIVGGQITDYGGVAVTEYGICYRIGQDAETCVAISEINNNTFPTTLEGLTPNTTYYVRAYATNEAGTSYGEEVSFTTLEEAPEFPEFPQGAIDGKFTVNAEGGQVYFSQGNLQYQASTNTWRFAEYQWNCVGEGNTNISETYSGWIDLFGWGTSGYNHGAGAYQPWSTSPYNSQYYAYGNRNYNLYDQTGQADWGYNAISNGGNTEKIGWRTLTCAEWSYIFTSRNTSSGIFYAKANVNGMNGIILLPDDWISSIYILNNCNNYGSSYDSNIITADDWTNILEANGAVFLPAAGYYDWVLIGPGDLSCYWSASRSDNSGVVCIEFNSEYVMVDSYAYRRDRHSVRLVYNAE